MGDAWAVELWRLIEEKTGIVPRDTGQRVILRWLNIQTSHGSAISPQAFVARLAQLHRTSPEWHQLLQLVTIGETSFLRDAEQLTLVVELLRARVDARLNRPLNIWSAGCSTGEEAYSLALLCNEASLDVRVMATDLSAASLEKAKQGRYESWALRNVDDVLRQKYFDEVALAPTRQGFQVKELLRAKVEFGHHNLLEAVCPLPNEKGEGWDIIICRNVFIYFRRNVVEGIAQRFAKALAQKGALLIGASESLHGLSVPLEPLSLSRRVAYQRTQQNTVPSKAVLVVPEFLHNAPSESPEAPPLEVAPQAFSPPAQTQPSLEWVIELAAVNKLDEASALLKSMVADDPSAGHYLAMGHLAMRAHDFDQALAAYGKARAADDLAPEVHFFEGILHRKAGNLVAAERALTSTLFLAPPCWQASFLLSGVYQRQGKAAEARRETLRTLRSLAETPNLFVFSSHSLFLAWFTSTKEDIERACKAALGAGVDV